MIDDLSKINLGVEPVEKHAMSLEMEIQFTNVAIANFREMRI